MKTFKSLKDLEKVIKKDIEEKIDNVLEHEVAAVAKEVIQSHVQSDVYDAYNNPKYYRRRRHDSGLIDENNLVEGVENNKLEIRNIATLNPYEKSFDDNGVLSFTHGGGTAGTGGSLSRMIIDGYGRRDSEFNRPRPFMENAQQTLNNNSEVRDAITKGLARHGIYKK